MGIADGRVFMFIRFWETLAYSRAYRTNIKRSFIDISSIHPHFQFYAHMLGIFPTTFFLKGLVEATAYN